VKLALFDFDGTLTTKDSLEEFIIYAVGKRHYYFKLLIFSPVYILYRLKLLHNSIAKEMLFRLYFNGMDEAEFKKLALEFSEVGLEPIIRENIYQKFLEHINNGDRVVLVSASMKCWLKPWSDKHSVELLSTELEFKDGKFSGHFKTKNCHGLEKLNRVKELLNLEDYEEIFTYGDSSGDDYILEIADHKTRV
jgi:phosphatidylglycerophosphatase C